jgi:hypothetical protein
MRNFDLSPNIGFPLPLKRSAEQEDRLVRWLNDEWEDPMPKFLKWKNYAGTGSPPMPADVPSDDGEDTEARNTIVTEFLPRLRRVQNITSATQTMKRAKRAMERHPGKYKDEDQAWWSLSGLLEERWLENFLASFQISATVPRPNGRSIMVVKGQNMTEAWAAHILLQLASAGALEKLQLCECGCGKWLLKQRKNARFYSRDACRQRSYRSPEQVKAKRRRDAQEQYDKDHPGAAERREKRRRERELLERKASHGEA